ncbi:spatacsin isoform 2 [Danio rerio]|uniref:Spatacsin isoform 2 n=1 Tax=Danio rerio TaxID=7955 RepID=D4HMK9_DANRE|nr:spatacsin isoform 2 [Danio rerio]ACO48451.1 spatacsin variant 2 [Danio rerio]|eukprot:NP_001167606.1 spatacsin isoform 2 [Danio rerio]
MLEALSRSDAGAQAVLEVDLLADGELCVGLKDWRRVKLSAGPSLLCCVNAQGETSLRNISDSRRAEHTLQHTCVDFLWEDVSVSSGARVKPKLLLLDSEFSLHMYDVDQDDQPTLVCETSSNTLLQIIKHTHADMCAVASVRLLCFSEGRCMLLVNTCVLLQLRLTEDTLEPISCCRLGVECVEECVDCRLCRGALFILLNSGLSYVFDSTDGQLLAKVDFPSYCCNAGVSPSTSSFCLLQISADLSTAVSVTRQNQAYAVHLDHYFSVYTDHLYCRAAPIRPFLRPVESWDQDSLSSSTHSLSALNKPLQADRSWESRLSALYNQTKAPVRPVHISPWYKDFPHIECRRAAATAKLCHSSVKTGGAVMSFNVPDGATPAGLNVSEFSALITFVSPANANTVLAYWGLENESVTYHRADANAIPVQRSAEENLCLLLKTSGLSVVLFCVSQDELLNRLMVFGSAGTVDSLCHLNAWGRCSIPIHALQAGLKNHQLDTVDFFLKSKENILSSSSGFSPGDPPPSSSNTHTHLRSIEALCPALDLLRSAIRDTHTEAQSQQFCEQLLSITMSFLNTQTRVLLSGAHDLDDNLQQCVCVLDGFISDLRVFLKRFPWGVGGDARTHTDAHTHTAASGREEEHQWISLSDEEVVHRAVLSRRISHAQAFLRRRGSAEHTLQDIRRTGLKHTHTCLTLRDLQQATTLLTHMGFNVKEQLHNICVYTADRDLRAFMVEELQKQHHLSADELKQVNFIHTIESLCSKPANRSSRRLDANRVLQVSRCDPQSRRLLEKLLQDSDSSSTSLLDPLRLHWVKHWDRDAQTHILLSRTHTHTQCSGDAAVLWAYLTSLHDSVRCSAWLSSSSVCDRESSAAPCWPQLTAHVLDTCTRCGEHLHNIILDQLARQGQFVPAEMQDSIGSVPLSDLSCIVELLILAHDCFSVTCNLEGIVRVLQACRHLSHTHLAHGDAHGLLVRLLTGIGRYNDMTYVFDLLHQNHRFEMLLRKKVESNVRLKTALLDYIKRCLPGDSEKHNMVALCFSMCREIGENHEAAARTQLKLIESQPWVITAELKKALVKVQTLLKDAAESYSKDSCVRQAVRCVKLAKLVTLQLHFLNQGLELRIINLQHTDLQNTSNTLPHCYQVFVLAEAYDFSPDWAEVLYQKVIMRGDFSYLEEFKRHRPLAASLFQDISNKVCHQKPPASCSQHLKKLLSHCEDVYTHYKLAYEHQFLDVANMLLQDSKTNSFLKDRLRT